MRSRNPTFFLRTKNNLVPIYVEGKGWLNAGELAEGDRLRRIDGGWARMLAIERVVLDTPEMVYNFTVRGLHTYFVLEAGVLVHNCDTIIELGLGSGVNLPNLTKHYPNAQIIGIDSWQGGYSPLKRLAEIEISQLPSGAARRIELRKGDYLDSFPGLAPADLVLNICPGSVSGHIAEAARGAAKLVDKRGQIYIATDLSLKNSEEIVDILLSGLQNRGIYARPGQIIPRRRSLSSWQRGNNYLNVPLSTNFSTGAMWELHLKLGQ